MAARENICSHPLKETLKAAIRGSVYDDPASRELYASDFGGSRYQKPLIVVKAVCREDITTALKFARQNNLPWTIRGFGGSFNGQSLSDGGILIENIAREPDFDFNQHTGRVSVSARTRWIDLEMGLNRVGRTIPVLPGFLDLTVGGTLSAGGYGLRSIQNGAQVDHVRRLELIRSDGSAIWCDPGQHRSEFCRALGGMGRAGVIERAVIDTQPHQPRVEFLLSALRAKDYLKLLQKFSEGAIAPPDYFSATLNEEVVMPQYGIAGDQAAGEIEFPDFFKQHAYSIKRQTVDRPAIFFHKRLSATVFPGLKQPVSQKIQHLWTDHLLNFEGFRKFLEMMQQWIANFPDKRLKPVGYALMIRQPQRDYRLPFQANQDISGKYSYGAGLYYSIPAAADDLLTAAHQQLNEAKAACLALGGSLYRCGWFDQEETTAAARPLSGYDASR